jgi:hypothetical protein
MIRKSFESYQSRADHRHITSPLFGQANQPAGGGGFIFSEAANNRRLELQVRFTF